MKKVLAVVSLSVLSLSVPSLAQMPPMPTPGPEHDMLKKDVGTWDATVEMFMAPGAPPEVSKGTETVTMMGGFWQLAEFKSEMMGQPFEGRGAMGYDPAKKKYVGTWVDTMTPGYSTVEATYDPAKKTMTGTMEGTGPDGVLAKTKETTVWTDSDARVFTMYAPDGTTPMMRISYKRRK
ncbi:MAG TPA: DUF1579 domain-containing protein [Vicinamibacteria bacterium]|nr:DUF1579 domain-containing protein [Vicinamibacteria bacterium]